MLSWLIALFALVLVTPATLLAANESGAERRVALVIGNNDYQHAKKLDNAVADAKAFRRELEARGFEVVYRENANRRTMNSAMEEFIGKLSTDTVGMIFYSGHGVQINGANYLVPTDLLAKVPADFVYDAVDLGKLIDRVAKTQAKFSLAVIDACRDNPFQGNGRDIGGTRGLVAPTGDATGVMIVYSAGANQKALDRLGETDKNPNGLFTREFLKVIRVPGLTVQEAVNQIKTTVIAQAKSVGHVQTPAIYDQSVGTFMFTANRGATTVPVAPVKPETTDAQIDQQGWAAAQAGNTVAGYTAYLTEYPKGRFASAARIALASLPARVAAVQSPPPIAAVGPIAATSLAAGQILQECADCPEMVMISAGSFDMGSTENTVEQPVYRVNVPAFFLGRTEVTQAQWIAVMGSNPSNFSNCGVDCPVENISWNDAQEFAKRLSDKTGKTYRLPSEAEWEYAARARSRGKWSFGDDESQSADHAWYIKNSGLTTHAVAQKRPNAFGLFDMHGNAWEWVQDIWHVNYQGAPSDGSAWVNGGDQAQRVVRGGGWYDLPWVLRSGNRIHHDPRARFANTGMRVVRTN